MFEWMVNNPELSAGIVGGIGAIAAAVIPMMKKTDEKVTSNANTNVNNNTVIIGGQATSAGAAGGGHATIKESARILFVDDDTSFQVVKIIKKSGWGNVKAIKDIDSLDAPVVRETNLFFIDIQGVGKALKFKDEGLGLAIALKNKYPDKKVVIYSAEPLGDRFHQGLRVADDFLSKTAEPYQFQQVIENMLLTKGGQ